MMVSSYSDQPPTYQQVSVSSQQQLYQPSAPLNPTVPVVSVVGSSTIRFGEKPITMICPYCGYTITTVVEEENGGIVFLICILLIIFGLFLGCCLIPFCISALKDKIHLCPKCQRKIGKKPLL